jgi:hypothetical protein
MVPLSLMVPSSLFSGKHNITYGTQSVRANAVEHGIEIILGLVNLISTVIFAVRWKEIALHCMYTSGKQLHRLTETRFAGHRASIAK